MDLLEDCSIADSKVFIIPSFSMAIAFSCFAIGRPMYRIERPKESFYNENLCRVSAAEYESKSCSTSDSEKMCAFAVWGVKHNSPNLINTTIEVKFGDSNSDRAIEEVAKYQVGCNESIHSVLGSLCRLATHIRAGTIRASQRWCNGRSRTRGSPGSTWQAVSSWCWSHC